MAETTGAIVQIVSGILKSTPAAERKELGRAIRTNAELWNTINGIGDIDPDLPKGTIKGTVRSDNSLLADVYVKAFQDGVEKASVQTDANGCYEIQLSAGVYDIEYSIATYTTETQQDKTVFSEIEMTFNADLKAA